MNWDIPLSVEIDGVFHRIRNECDYRVVLDVNKVLNDDDLPLIHRIDVALQIFYENSEKIKDIEKATKEMFRIINIGEENAQEDENKPKLMDWEQDFNLIAPAISRVLGYSVRDPRKITHWWDFIGAYMEIGSECSFSTVISIRAKKAKGKKLEKHEQEFYNENKKIIDLKKKITAEEEEWLNSDW